MSKICPFPGGRPNISRSRRSRYFLLFTIILFCVSHPQFVKSGEHVIFEQIGQLAGSTSYLHAHITVSVTAIEEQLTMYESMLRTEFSDYMKVHALIKMNLDNTSHVNFPDDNRNFSSSKLYMAAVSWTKMARLHLDEVVDIREHVDSLRNLLPDKPADNINRVAHDPAFFEDLQQRINMDSYVPDDGNSPLQRRLTMFSGADDVKYPVTALHDEEENIPFPFKVTPMHQASYQQLTQSKVNLAVVTDESKKSKTTTPKPYTFQPYRRSKRVAGLIALPIAIAATAMGIYNSVQIEFLKTELLEVKDNVKRLFEVIQRFDKELNEISGAIRDLTNALIILNVASPSFFDARLSKIENQIRNRLRMATHALQAAQHRRLAIDYLSPKQIRVLFSKLQARAAEFGCELLIAHHSDLFQIEVSLLFDGSDAHLLVHVPMVPINSLLRLFKLHPFPLPFFDNHFLVPNVQQDVLAISSNDHRLSTHLSSVDLLGCHRVNQIFMCD